MTTTFKEVEAARLAYLKKIRKYSLFGVISTVGMLILSFWTLFILLPVAIFLGAFWFYLAVGSKERVNYQRAYKAYFVEKELEATFSELKYNHTSGLNPRVLAATGMVNLGDRFNSNDFATGRYKDVGFTQADVHIETEYTDSEGHASYTTIFKGRWMIFEFPKKFNFRLEVIEKGFRAYQVPKGDAKTGRKFEKVQVESPEFNKMFKVWAEDGFETFYLLDPSLIDNITKLGEAYKGQMLLCFVDNRLYVGLNDKKDAFEPPNVFKKLDEATEKAKIKQDVGLITDFVDKLKLSKGIFR